MGGFAMTCFGCVLSVAVFFSCFIEKLEAQTLKVTSNPTGSTYVKPGENVTLDITYDYTGSKVVQVDWRKDLNVLIRKHGDGSVSRPENRSYLNGVNFVLTNPEQKDNGTYTVELKAGDVFTKVPEVDFVVIIQEKPTAIINCSTPMTVKEGDNFECLCYSSGGNPPPIASWYKGGMKVSGPGYLKQTLLKNITKEDAGNYSCVVKSHDLNDTKQMEIHVQYKPTIISFISDQKNNTVSVGKIVIITCKADAFPAPNYIILHNGVQLKDGVNGVKIINSVNISYDGRYQCVANNSVGNASKSFNLTVKEQPTAHINCSTARTVKEGVKFECLCYSSGGNPPPFASWYKDGMLVSGPGYLKQILSKNITKEDAGNYSCIVKSNDLNDTKQMEIHVQYIPTIISFISDQKNNTVSVGKIVTITCQADAFPAPNYIIFHKGAQLKGVVNGVKIINSVNISNDGRYECVANNSVGNMSESFKLTVKVRPTANTNCSTPVTVNEGGHFECLCFSIVANSSASAYWYKDGTKYFNKTLSWKNIRRKDAGTYTCVVKSLDLNDTKKVNIQVNYKPTNISFKSEDGNSVSLGTNVTITCKAEALPEPNYTIFHKDQRLVDAVNGTKIIKSVSDSDIGYYKCVAKNILGNVSASLNLTVTVKDTTTNEGLPTGVIVGIAVGGVILLILIVVLLWWCHCCNCCPCYNRWCGYEEKLNSTDGRIPENGISNVVADCGAYESVDKTKLGSVADQAGTSEDPAPASPPAMPPVYAVVDKSVKKKLPPIEKPESLTYASLDPVALQPDSSKMRERTREQSNYADIDMTDIHGKKT